MNYLYLHGFASSPKSSKAIFLQAQFAQVGLTLDIPDLNLNNFSEVSLTKQLNYLKSKYGESPLVVIGSSLGGYLALQMAIAMPQVQKLILLAPAFEFSKCLAESLGEEAIAQWQAVGTRAVYHYGFKQEIPLNYEFYSDAQTYLPKSLERELPILIIHGNNDEVVPCSLSRDFVSTALKNGHHRIILKIVESDHSLGNVMDLIWQKTATFLELDLKVLD